MMRKKLKVIALKSTIFFKRCFIVVFVRALTLKLIILLAIYHIYIDILFTGLSVNKIIVIERFINYLSLKHIY